MFVRHFAALAALLAAAVAPAAQAAKEPVLNKEGYWAVDIERAVCTINMRVESGDLLIFEAKGGAVTFGVVGKKRLPRGKTGYLVVDGESFEIPFRYTEDAQLIFYEGQLGANLLTKLDTAKELHVFADKREVTSANLQGTGLAGALDAVAACSKGEAGWWGKGVDFEALKAVAYQEFWDLKRAEDGVCTMFGLDANDAAFLVASKGGERVQVSVASKRLGRRGDAGVLRIDGQSFDFKPDYDGSQFFAVGMLAAERMAELGRAKSVVVSVEGREVLDLRPEGMHLDAALAAFIACAKGEAGPWSEAASR